MNQPPQPRPSDAPIERSGYPLGMLFLLIALVAILLAMDAAVLRDRLFQQISFERLLMQVALASIATGVFGCLIGMFHARRELGFFLGLITGLLLGPLLLPILAAQESHIGPLLMVTIFGCGLMLAMAIAIRLGTARRTTRSRAWHED